MASILHTAAQKINTDMAGRTTDPTEPNAGAPQAATPAEVFHSVFTAASGSLDSMFRQEPVMPSVASSAEVQATSATRGPHGGLVPAALSKLRDGMAAPAPGPGPTHSTPPAGAQHGTATHRTGVTTDVTNAAANARMTAATWLAFARRRLGV